MDGILNSNGFWTIMGAVIAALSGMASTYLSQKLENNAKAAEKHSDRIERLRCEQIDCLECLSKLLAEWARYCGTFYSTLQEDLLKHGDDPKKARGDEGASESMRLVTGEILVTKGKIIDSEIRERVQELVSEVCLLQDRDAIFNWVIGMSRKTMAIQNLIAQRRRMLELQGLSAEELALFGRVES